MTPRLVTFDCAQTLVEVNWTVDGFLRTCAEAAGLHVPDAAFETYKGAFFARIGAYHAANLTRDPRRVEAFWADLARDWLAEIGEDTTWLAPLLEAYDRLAFGPNSVMFRRYDDAIPCLDGLVARGIRLAVVSNWDTSLHLVLRSLGMYRRFDRVYASLEEGMEKPDPRLFRLCLEALGVSPEETVHVGDSPIDDGEGAARAGIRCVLIDRAGEYPTWPGPRIRTLADLPEALDWNG